MRTTLTVLADPLKRIGDQMLERLVPRTSAAAAADFYRHCFCGRDPYFGQVYFRQQCEYGPPGYPAQCEPCKPTTTPC